MFNAVVVLWEKKFSYVFCFALEVFKWWRTVRASFNFFFSSVNYRRSYSIHLKKSRLAEDVLVYPKNEVMAFPKVEIKWVWVSDIHVYIKADAAIWLWRYCHVDRKCVVQTNWRVKWSWFYSEMSECRCRTTIWTRLIRFFFKQLYFAHVTPNSSTQLFFLSHTWARGP